MDPNAAWREVLSAAADAQSAIERQDRDAFEQAIADVQEYAGHLAEWTARGGFIPTVE